LGAVVHVVLDVNAEGGRLSIIDLPNAAVPREVFLAFCRSPRRFRRLKDLQTALALSRRRARALVRASGFQRAEHLFARLRSHLEAALRERGVSAVAARGFAGIADAATQRRSLKRAMAAKSDAQRRFVTEHAR
jgi:hypothetical protein